MNPDDIYLAGFPFGGSAGMKLRPVLLLTGPIGSVPEVVVAYISSVIPSVSLRSDILLDPAAAEHASTNLKTKSVLRLHKLATIHARRIRHVHATDGTRDMARGRDMEVPLGQGSADLPELIGALESDD